MPDALLKSQMLIEASTNHGLIGRYLSGDPTLFLHTVRVSDLDNDFDETAIDIGRILTVGGSKPFLSIESALTTTVRTTFTKP